MHTKGPWELILNYDNNLKGSIKGRHTIKDSDGWNIARIWESAPNAEANARLIAAAPELLEALRHIEAELNWWENTDDIIDHDNRRSLANVATEAIRKASR